MLIANKKAQVLLTSGFKNEAVIDEKIRKMLLGGISVINKLIILNYNKASLENANYTMLIDETGVECFVNHIHLDDFQQINEIGEALSVSLKISRSFIDDLQVKSIKAKIIISIDDEINTSIRFHGIRKGQSWLSDNLDDYEEAILVLES